MLGIVISLAAGALVGLLIGIYLIADQVCRTEHGCIACGRPWHTYHAHIERDSNVRVIPPEAIDVPLPPEGDPNE